MSNHYKIMSIGVKTAERRCKVNLLTIHNNKNINFSEKVNIKKTY